MMAKSFKKARVWLIVAIKISADRTLEIVITKNSMAILIQPVTCISGNHFIASIRFRIYSLTLNADRNLWLIMLYRNGFTHVEK